MRKNLSIDELRAEGITPLQQLKDIQAVYVGKYDRTSKMKERDKKPLSPHWSGQWRRSVNSWFIMLLDEVRNRDSPRWQMITETCQERIEACFFKLLNYLEKRPAKDGRGNTIYRTDKSFPVPQITPSWEQVAKIAHSALSDFQLSERDMEDEYNADWDSGEGDFFHSPTPHWLDTDLTDYELTSEDMDEVFERIGRLGIVGDAELLGDIYDAIWVHRELASVHDRLRNRKIRKLVDAFNSPET